MFPSLRDTYQMEMQPSHALLRGKHKTPQRTVFVVAESLREAQGGGPGGG